MYALHHPRGVLCAQAGHKVNFKEYPPTPGFCPGDFAARRFALQRNRVDVQKVRSLFKSEHAKCARLSARD